MMEEVSPGSALCVGAHRSLARIGLVSAVGCLRTDDMTTLALKIERVMFPVQLYPNCQIVELN